MAESILKVGGNIFMIFVVIGIHEIGHLAMGLIQGFRFELFVIGPLGVKRENNKIKIYLNRNLEYFGGVAGTLPKDDKPENIDKFAKILIAGPIASILLSIFLGLIYFSFDYQFKSVIGTGALISIGIFLATTIPSKTGVFFTDRKRYQRLKSTGLDREVELAVFRILGIYGRDNSYIKVEPNDIELMIQDVDYRYLGLFTKLSYQHEKNGFFDIETKNEFTTLSKEMPKSLVKSLEKELEKLKK